MGLLSLKMTYPRTHGGWDHSYFVFPWLYLAPWLLLAYFLWGGGLVP